MGFFHVGGVVTILVDEDGTAVVVEGFPEKCFGSKAEHEEVTRGGAVADRVGDGF